MTQYQYQYQNQLLLIKMSASALPTLLKFPLAVIAFLDSHVCPLCAYYCILHGFLSRHLTSHNFGKIARCCDAEAHKGLVGVGHQQFH